MSRPRHPSGRPIRMTRITRLPITRSPEKESLIPGLRDDELADAIGFHHNFIDVDEADDDDEEYDD